MYIVLGLSSLFLAIIVVYIIFIDDKKAKKDVYSRTPYGDARLMSDSEFNDLFPHYELDSENHYGGGLVVSSKRNKVWINTKDVMNLVFGQIGSGKTQLVVLPTILNICACGESMIINDPKPELYGKTAQYLIEHGYDVHLLNFNNTRYGDQYNFMDLVNKNTSIALDSLYHAKACHYILQALKNKDMTQNYITEIQAIFEKQKPNSQDTILNYRKNEICIRIANICESLKDGHYDKKLDLVERLQQDEKDYLYQYYDFADEANQKAEIIAKTILATSGIACGGNSAIWEESAIALITTLIQFVSEWSIRDSQKHLGSVYRLFNILQCINLETKKYMLDEVIDTLSDLDIIKASYAPVKSATGDTKSSIFFSASTPLKTFRSNAVAKQCSATTIDLLSLDKKPTAIFIYPMGKDENSVTTGLCSLFISQLYQTLVEHTKTNNGMMDRPVHLILDELPQIFIDNFASKLAICRSRKIFWHGFVQTLSQLKTIYKDEAEAIMDNCSLMYLLSNDNELLNEISESVGYYQTSVKNLSTSKTKESISISESESKMSRAIFTVDELRNFEFGSGLYLQSGNLPVLLNFTPFYKMPINKKLATLKQKEVDEKQIDKQMNDYFIVSYAEIKDSIRKFNKDELFMINPDHGNMNNLVDLKKNMKRNF